MGYYKSKFSELPCFQVEITPQLCERLIACCTYFETKDQHPSALNTPLLGVTPIYFTSIDVSMLFSILGIDVNDLNRIIAESQFTEDNWVVTNDPYNHTIIYLVHRILSSTRLKESDKTKTATALLKLLHYKYFTSLVGNSYPYGADEATMTWVVNNINKKYDLAKLETWKKVIESRCEYLLSSESIHLKTFMQYEDDVAILYVISDTQSNLRQKIVRINRLYYEAKEKNEAIGQYNTLDTLDGTKIIASSTEVFDLMNVNMQLQIQSPTRLLDMELIEVITSKYKEVSSELFRLTLTKFCDLTTLQMQDKKMKKIVNITNQNTGEKEPVYVSTSYLLSEFIQKTYRYCIMTKDLDMSSKKAILLKVINIYTSSQMVDKDILTIKRSFIYFVTKSELSRRPATISALSLCMIIYLLIRSFEFVK